MGRRHARKNPSTTTWLAAGVAAVAVGAWWWYGRQAQGGVSAVDAGGYSPAPAGDALVPASAGTPTATYPVATEAGIWAGRAGGAAPVATSSGPMARPTATLSTADQKLAKTLIAQYTAAVARGDTAAAAKYLSQLQALGVTPTTAGNNGGTGGRMVAQRRG